MKRYILIIIVALLSFSAISCKKESAGKTQITYYADIKLKESQAEYDYRQQKIRHTKDIVRLCSHYYVPVFLFLYAALSSHSNGPEAYASPLS